MSYNFSSTINFNVLEYFTVLKMYEIFYSWSCFPLTLTLFITVLSEVCKFNFILRFFNFYDICSYSTTFWFVVRLLLFSALSRFTNCPILHYYTLVQYTLCIYACKIYLPHLNIMFGAACLWINLWVKWNVCDQKEALIFFNL